MRGKEKESTRDRGGKMRGRGGGRIEKKDRKKTRKKRNKMS